MSVTLLERQLDFEREFRGEILMPSGLDALEQMGLREAMARVPQSCPSSVEAFANGRSFLHVGLEPELFGGRPPVAMCQPALLEMLVAEAGRSSGFHFERGATVRELIREGDRCRGVRARTAAGEREFRAALVVGADGRSSVVRPPCALSANSPSA